MAQEDTGNQNEEYLKEFVSISKVKEYVNDSNQNKFLLLDLEKIYIEHMAEQGKDVQSHITRFATKLECADIGLKIIQGGKSSKYLAIKKECIDKIASDTDWIELVKRTIIPIRNEIIQAHDMSKPPMSDLQPWKINCPKLRFLISFICLGSPEIDNLPLSIETICQQIIYNSKITYRPYRAKTEETVDSVRHSRNSECPVTHYTTIKLYSIIRSRTLLQALHQFGIILSYSRVCTFYSELSQIVKVLII